ncbi:MAG TPA: hypothetical protein VES03_03910 [Motilibacterales bacterium]|nr:hypothetical protein [Motilibacterales bacterium]
MVDTLVAEVALSAADRCDRCGAQAIARATLSSGAHLLFCGHHLRAHEASLRQISARIAKTSGVAHHPGGGELTTAE